MRGVEDCPHTSAARGRRGREEETAPTLTFVPRPGGKPGFLGGEHSEGWSGVPSVGRVGRGEPRPTLSRSREGDRGCGRDHGRSGPARHEWRAGPRPQEGD